MTHLVFFILHHVQYCSSHFVAIAISSSSSYCVDGVDEDEIEEAIASSLSYPPHLRSSVKDKGIIRKNPFPYGYYYYGPEASKGRSRKKTDTLRRKKKGELKTKDFRYSPGKNGLASSLLWGAAAIEEKGKKGFFCPVSQKSATTTLLYPHFLSLSRIFLPLPSISRSSSSILDQQREGKKFWGSGARGEKKLPKSPQKSTSKGWKGGWVRCRVHFTSVPSPFSQKEKKKKSMSKVKARSTLLTPLANPASPFLVLLLFFLFLFSFLPRSFPLSVFSPPFLPFPPI